MHNTMATLVLIQLSSIQLIECMYAQRYDTVCLGNYACMVCTQVTCTGCQLHVRNSKSVQPKFSHDPLRIGRGWVCMKYLWSHEPRHNLNLIHCMTPWLKPFTIHFFIFCYTCYYSIPHNIPIFAPFFKIKHTIL